MAVISRMAKILTPPALRYSRAFPFLFARNGGSSKDRDVEDGFRVLSWLKVNYDQRPYLVASTHTVYMANWEFPLKKFILKKILGDGLNDTAENHYEILVLVELVTMVTRFPAAQNRGDSAVLARRVRVNFNTM